MAFSLPVLTGFSSTMPLSDSLQFISGSCFIITRSTYSLSRKKLQGLPGCRLFFISNMPSSTTPEKQCITRQYAMCCFDFHVFNRVILPSYKSYRGSIRSTLCLRPVVLITLCLTFGITPAGPTISTWWLACLARVGLTPTRTSDLARPH